MSIKPKLTTISYDVTARDDIDRQLGSVMGDVFDITSYSCDEYLAIKEPKDKFVLLTAPFVADLVRDHLPANCVSFIAKREINPRQIRKLLKIPHGADVLVVNTLHQNAQDMVEELRVLGFGYLSLVPHDPEAGSDNTYQYAITANETALVPEGIPHVINIGTRHISLMSIAKILFYFNVTELQDNILVQRYTRYLVAMSVGLYRKQQKNILLQNYMRMTLSNFDDGAVITNINNEIIFYNDKACNLLGTEALLGKSIHDVNPEILNEDSQFVSVAGKILYIVTKEYVADNDETFTIITLKDTGNITEIESKFTKYRRASGLFARFSFADIVHKSRAMAEVVAVANRFAQKDATLLITGESGTGKELFAQAVHNASTRKDGPFVALNCAALSESLLESELFGYEEGAFTGATRGGKKGLFELANGGTIFLDEIGDAPLATQIKMLRVLQEREIMPVAGSKVIPVNVRVIAASNKDLLELVDRRTFREDLYYRLNVLNIHVPPLRERDEDARLLLEYFLGHFGTSLARLDRKILDMLKAHTWPGNVRELKNIAEFIATVSDVTPNPYAAIARMLRQPNQAGSAPSPAPDKFLFRNPEMAEDIVAILRILAEAQKNNQVLGRGSVQQILAEKGINLSVQQVKTRLDSLRQSGFVQARNGKGTYITDRGEEYLREL
ncbi:sigma 54-interacting transcriptional regulator [Desulfovibrio sp. OttesenSCG-928-O18]|nr:sigma 54-interacting transcriptional regulator [Desulfovibrio sp. OttesenSCG-928-O18]